MPRSNRIARAKEKDFIKMSAKAGFEYIMEEKGIIARIKEESKKNGKRGINTVRQLIEIHSPTVQCNNVLGEFQPDISTCWLCGEVITMIQKKVCEHVLPIFQASFLWSLYTKNVEDTMTANDKKKYLNYLKPEYGWAHTEPCNSLKKDIVFIQSRNPVDMRAGVQIDTDTIKRYLNALAIKKGIRSRSSWIEERERDITERLKTMVDFINSEERGLPLTVLAGVALLKNPDTYNNENLAQIILGEDLILNYTPLVWDEPHRVEFINLIKTYESQLFEQVKRHFTKYFKTDSSFLEIRGEVTKIFPGVKSLEELYAILFTNITSKNPNFIYDNFYVPYAILYLNDIPKERIESIALEIFNHRLIQELYSIMNVQNIRTAPVKRSLTKSREISDVFLRMISAHIKNENVQKLFDEVLDGEDFNQEFKAIADLLFLREEIIFPARRNTRTRTRTRRNRRKARHTRRNR